MNKGKTISILKSGWMILAFVILTIILCLVNWYSYEKMRKALDREFSDRLRVLAEIVAQETSLDSAITLQPEFGEFLQSDTTFQRLKHLAESYSISNINIIREDGILLFTLNPDLFEPGELYPHWSMDYEYIISALDGKITATKLYRAPDGSFLKAGYASIRVEGNGLEAVVCVEASAGFLSGLNELRQILFIAILVSVGGILLFMALAIKATSSLIKARESLLRSETLASMGRMAAGIAHEIRNPLFIIRSSAESLKEENPQLSEQIDEYIIDEVDRLNETLSDYLLFSRDEPAEKRPMDIAKTLNRSVKLIEGEAEKTGISIEKKIELNSAPFIGEEKKLRQAFLNILLNAIQAIDGEGKITVRLTKNQKYYEIQIEDTGVGIAQEELEKVFEPFYTSKPSGSGLGLSIVRSIIETHDGMIEIESKKGKGTRVTITLPLQRETETE